VKELNPQLQYFCDPVMGDNGKLYVPEAVGLALILMLTLNLIPNPNSLCVFEALVEVYKTEITLTLYVYLRLWWRFTRLKWSQ